MDGKIFYRSVPVCFVLLFLLFTTVSAKPPVSEDEKAEVVASAKAALMEMVTLWHDERYGELYDYGTLHSQQKLSREEFEKRMRRAKKRLECCWATIQEVNGVYQSASEVHLKAKMGYRPPDVINLPRKGSVHVSEETVFEHETFYLIYQNDRWHINLFQILKMSGR